ncbi:nickel-dependent hydrogenase large subunit [uncultured Mailhella sp.]|uniref:nickel-dependent hydrogenase large subunit n=1 Tax=uncultured Mailhella sp. TaxID=1981031 RepID=UPI0025E14DA2|nr:nickel-dependent hydrogenase large subunit [uncultured Mailhella sp.]
MAVSLAIDPVTRIEGHLKARLEVDGNMVRDAWLTGGMFRGFETILMGRDPTDAPQIVQRICGVCPVSHALASCMALEDAFSIDCPRNGVLLRNLMQGANFLQSHILSFYQLSSQDFFQGPAEPPFFPRRKKSDLRLGEAATAMMLAQYLESLDIRALCHEMAAVFGGRMPHVHGIVPGGASSAVTSEKKEAFRSRLKKVRTFIEERYVPLLYLLSERYADLARVGRGWANALCMGVFPHPDTGSHSLHAGVWAGGRLYPFEPDKVMENVGHSWFSEQSGGSPFRSPPPVVDLDKAGAYSFSKAARYHGMPMEVGPHARLWINDTELSPMGRELAPKHLGRHATHFCELGEAFVFSIMGRHLARAEETWMVAEAMEGWLNALTPGESTLAPLPDMTDGEGYSLTEAPRGSLMHCLKVKDGRLSFYQILPATLWNASPRDDAGLRGPMEEALVGLPVPDKNNPVNAGRLVRAFDP